MTTKFRYIICENYAGTVQGTNELSVVDSYIEDDGSYIIDVQAQKEWDCAARAWVDIKEASPVAGEDELEDDES